MKSILSAVISCLLTTLVFSQLDTVDISFSSDFERLALTKSTDHLEQLLAVKVTSKETAAEVQKRLDADFERLRAEGFESLKASKQIKYLHQFIHDNYLKKYELVSPFNEIFENGTYNCVSSTGLFALFLEEFSIPYSIQELPSHVYIIAYPTTHNISVEMTDPQDGSSSIGRMEVVKIVKALADNKLISEDDLKTRDPYDIYNDFFYAESTINLTELAALQYYNEALENYEKDQRKAINYMQKASLLYDNRRFKLLTFLAINEVVSASDMNSLSDLRWLLLLAKENEKGNQDYFSYKYGMLIQRNLLEQGREAFVDSSFLLIEGASLSPELHRRLAEFYYLGKSEYYSKRYNRKKALEYAKSAYENNPQSINAQSELTRELYNQLINENLGEHLATTIDSMMVLFPFLTENNLILSLKFAVHCDVSNEYYSDNDPVLGEKHMNIALDIYNTMPDNGIIDRYDIGSLYASPGAYYYRQKEYAKAMEFLEEGLKLSPDNGRLKSQIETVRRYYKD